MAKSSGSVEGKMKELSVGGSKQKHSSKPLEVRTNVESNTEERLVLGYAA